MSLSDTLSIGAVAISVITFVITTYEQYLKAAKLQLVLGQQLWFSYSHEKTNVGFWANVAIANQGAVDAVVLNINGTLRSASGQPMKVGWYTFGDFDSGKGTFVSQGWTETLVASSRKATTAWIGFSTKDALDGAAEGALAPGVYALELSVQVPVSGIRLLATFGRRSSVPRTAVTWTGTFELTAQNIADLRRYAVADAENNVDNPLLVQVTGAERWLRRQSATSVLPGAKGMKAAGGS